MKPINKYFCAAALLSFCLSAAAQDATETKTLTFFKGDTIREVQLSGGFDVEIRQGTPNGVTLEIGTDIPVDTEKHHRTGLEFKEKWQQQLSAQKIIPDTVDCRLEDGVLTLSFKPHYEITPLPGGGCRIQGRKPAQNGKAVITVGDLRALRAYTGDPVRFVGKMRTTETELYVGPMEGLNITATRSVSINTWFEANLQGRITATPQVEIKMNTKGMMDLTLDSVGYLSVLNYAGGRVELSGAVDSLYTRTYGQGAIDTRNLKAGEIVPPKTERDSGLSDALETYILEKKGKNTTIRKMK